jgi:protein-S-isoprenylcysteine O-methyltransferase Ste14
MSCLPALKIGLWNAWVLMIYLPLHPLIMVVVDKAVGTGGISKKMTDVPYERGEKRVFIIYMAALLVFLVLSVFTPLKLGTVWFYVGLAAYLVGLVMFLTAIVNIATTPLGRPFKSGMYRYSRHPMLLSGSITFVGVSVASASLPLLALSLAIIALQASEAVAEERGCLETYGEEYQEYLNRTPRWIGMPKSR